jgi:hypothetical protein
VQDAGRDQNGDDERSGEAIDLRLQKKAPEILNLAAALPQGEGLFQSRGGFRCGRER